jgi:23S rRNA (cytidine1920-2'-O)/16S rRNA (cytidine1409-2'-O)-methyltransferase
MSDTVNLIGPCATTHASTVEHFNARHLTLADLPGPVDIVCIDVSFISLRQILPVVPPLLRPDADVAAPVKPQFEAGRAEVRKGVIHDPAIHARVVEEIRGGFAVIDYSRDALADHRPEGQRRVSSTSVHDRSSRRYRR